MPISQRYLMVCIVGGAIALTAPALAAISPQPDTASIPGHQRADLFHTLDVIEDVDDLLDGDIGDIDPIRDFTEDIEGAVDDVNDTIEDITDIDIYEPFTDIDDRVEDFADDIDDTMRHISNDVEDWFD